ncbi:serine hydrolase domain-containing protein [Shimia biformata]|uniref:serine hydrolase domain-containing protein n=1 Tax=Shimia biformata TaxID=1294299 RepID=UPI00194FAB4E|nr:serine hydrolase [Shimia biformata]
MRELVPTVPVPRGGTVWDLPGADENCATGDITFARGNGETITWDGFLDLSYTDATLIWHDGRVLSERYFNNMTPTTEHIAFSVSKSVVATVAGMLIDDGLLDPDAPITDPLPELAQTAWTGATLGQVLDMTSGVKFDESYGNPDAQVFLLDVAANLKPLYPWMKQDEVPATIWELIQSLKSTDAPHGSRFEYRSIETDCLGFAMERVSGQRLPQLLSDRLWGPMGAERDACFTVDRGGFAMADGGLNATLRDMARFGRLLLEDGRRDGRQVVPKSWIDDIRHGAHGLANQHLRDFLPNGRYRNQFWIMDENGPAHLSLGIFGQHILVDPETGTVAVKFSSWPTFLSDEGWVMDWVRGVRAVVAAHSA